MIQADRRTLELGGPKQPIWRGGVQSDGRGSPGLSRRSLDDPDHHPHGELFALFFAGGIFRAELSSAPEPGLATLDRESHVDEVDTSGIGVAEYPDRVAKGRAARDGRSPGSDPRNGRAARRTPSQGRVLRLLGCQREEPQSGANGDEMTLLFKSQRWELGLCEEVLSRYAATLQIGEDRTHLDFVDER